MAGMLARWPLGMRPWFRHGSLANLREDLEELFSELADGGSDWWDGKFSPPMDLSETDSAVEVKFDVPGFKSDEIDIQLVGSVLTVSGERKEEREVKGRTMHRVERRFGRFTRSVNLPCAVKEEKVDARYHDGVLTITLAKTERAKTHKIAVKS